MEKIFFSFCLGATLAALVAWQLSVHWSKKQHQRDKKLLRRTRGAERLAELGTLTSGLAHEIRNPLSTIKMNLQLLSENVERQLKEAKNSQDPEDEPLDSTAQNYRRYLRKLNLLIGETDRLSETLNEFLRYAGKMELHPINCDVNEILDDLIDFFEPQAHCKNIQIRKSLCREPLKCSVDVDLLKQAFLNLFINAIQAMEHSGELIIRTSRTAENALINITDTGPGIDPQLKEKIFDAYYTTRSGGTGLGLPTCRRIIEEHRGHIELHSEPGKGSNFTIELPRAVE
ncbi:MAG: hypothetical protein JXD22_14780 [Sedimentisphaerales bacterium]|nr:hypothetical protein [Sedimentisphaerales bacterium]